jgi:hypothetical protein
MSFYTFDRRDHPSTMSGILRIEIGRSSGLENATYKQDSYKKID